VGLFPTDHVIRDVPAFVRGVGTAVKAAEAGALVCLGIRPDRPATGFGYLKCGARPRAGRVVDVVRFVEKPDERRARRFLSSGNYLWNGGMFVWRAERFLEEAARVAAEVVEAVRSHLAGKRGAWARAPRRSVDFAVMEQARGVRVVPLDAGWDDVGSWDAAARVRDEGRAGRARGGDRDQLLIDSPGAAVFGSGRLIAIVDAPGITVVDTPDALLVVSRNSSERIRQVVDELRRRGRDDLL
jgi:mannose-1-phosphate guanylyltransferase